jgi:hypothetical protein
MRALTAMLVAIPVLVAGSQSYKNTAPESFRANGQMSASQGGVASSIDIAVDKYSTDAEHEALVKALQQGYEPFVEALRKQPQIGSVKLGPNSYPVRWARERPTDKDHRRVAVVTDKPVYFFGAGAADAKPTAGYEVALVEFTVDTVGLGTGSMAPAARVKAGGPTGIEIQDYSGTLIQLRTVIRNLK